MAKPLPDRETIRKLRQARGVKVSAFAAKVGISAQHMYNIENGYKGASIEVLNRIAAALDVPTAAVTADAA